MVIVEGMDNSGKTTLVRQLSEDCRLLVMNNRRRPKTRQDILDYVAGVVPLAQRFPVILDRFAPISEPIYGPICRNTELLTRDDISQCLLRVTAEQPKPAVIIYCRPRATTILQFGPIPQMEGVIENGRALLQAYDETMKKLGSFWFTVLYYDWEHDSYSSLKNQVSLHFQNYAN